MGKPYHATIRGSSDGGFTGKLRFGDRLVGVVDSPARGLGLHARAETSFHQHAASIPNKCEGWHHFEFLGDRLVWSRVLSDHTSVTIHLSTRPGGHGANSLGSQLVSLPSQYPLGPAIHRPHCFALSSCPNSVVREGSRCLGVAWRPFLRLRSILSFSRFRKFLGLVYAPQMLPSPLEVSNLAEDEVVRAVAPTPEADDALPPAKVLPGRPNGVSSL